MSFNTGAQLNTPISRPPQDENHQVQDHPPTYTSPPPPNYPDLTRISSHLMHGPLDETISVPMILSTESKRKRDLFMPFGGRRGSITQTVIVRKMTRKTYLEHYAKDAEGNYVGTGKRAVDAGLVFVPGKSTPEDLLKQVKEVAFGKEHDQGDFANAWGSPLGGGGYGGGGA